MFLMIYANFLLLILALCTPPTTSSVYKFRTTKI